MARKHSYGYAVQDIKTEKYLSRYVGLMMTYTRFLFSEGRIFRTKTAATKECGYGERVVKVEL